MPVRTRTSSMASMSSGSAIASTIDPSSYADGDDALQSQRGVRGSVRPLPGRGRDRQGSRTRAPSAPRGSARSAPRWRTGAFTRTSPSLPPCRRCDSSASASCSSSMSPELTSSSPRRSRRILGRRHVSGRRLGRARAPIPVPSSTTTVSEASTSKTPPYGVRMLLMPNGMHERLRKGEQALPPRLAASAPKNSTTMRRTTTIARKTSTSMTTVTSVRTGLDATRDSDRRRGPQRQ